MFIGRLSADTQNNTSIMGVGDLLSLVYSTIKSYPIPVLAVFTLWMGIFDMLLVMVYPHYPNGMVVGNINHWQIRT